MKMFKLTSILTLLLMFSVLSLSQAQETKQHAKEHIQDWPETAKKAAKATLDQYGAPDVVSQEMLVWFDNGEWHKTVVQREEIDHNFPVPHKDVLYQEIKYDVPSEMFDELARYDGSVIVERTKGTIGARCDKEAANHLAINLAHDIVENEKSVEEAREFFAETMRKMMMKNESSKYLKGFIFDMPRGETADPGEALIDISEMKMGDL